MKVLMMRLLPILLIFLASPAIAQEQNVAAGTRLAPYYQQQRNTALDNLAACAVMVSDLQAKIAELEKKLADLNAAQSK